MSEEYLYNKPLKPLANELRTNSTFGEVILVKGVAGKKDVRLSV